MQMEGCERVTYISREAAIKRFNFAVLDCLGMEPTIRAGDIIKALESIPAADVRPVVRGKWKKMLQNTDGTSDYECSACGGLILDVPDNDEHPLCGYCPNCGAKMEES